MALEANCTKKKEERSPTTWQSSVTYELSPNLAAKAQEELNEHPDQRDLALQALRAMIITDTKLTAPTNDAFLLRFLRARKFNIDRSFQLLQNFYSMAAKHPQLYANFRPSSMLKTLKENLHQMLPDRDQLGRRIFLIRPGRWNPKVCTREDLFLCMQICLESAIPEEETQINGFVVIIDMKDFTLSKAAYVTPGIVTKFTSLLQNWFPARFKGIHFVNEPSFFGAVFMIIKQFLNAKIRSRINFHRNNLATLHEFIPPAILPEELGGLMHPTNNSSFVDALMSRDDEIANTIENYGYNGLSEARIKRLTNVRKNES